jgi:hypothetical protein
MKKISFILALLLTSHSISMEGSGGADQGAGVEKEVAEVTKRITAGLVILNSTVTATLPIVNTVDSKTRAIGIAIEYGAEIGKNYHGLEYYHSTETDYDSNFEMDKAWGINYNYYRTNNLNTDMFDMDFGAKIGFNYFGEYTRNYEEKKNEFKSIRFGGPQILFRFTFNHFGFGTGYSFLMGYEDQIFEGTSVKEFTGTSLWNTQFFVNF